MRVAASAPGRCGIIGNPSDIYGGRVLSCTIEARAQCELAVGGREELPSDPTLWRAASSRFPVEGAQVRWTTDIPVSSGLSGSTALLAATLACLLRARNETPALQTADERIAFAELVRDVEANEAGIVCGYQDATIISLGYAHLMDFAGKHPLEGGPPPRVRAVSVPDPPPFLLVTTGVERLSGSVHGPIRDRWLTGEQAVKDAMSRLATLAPVGASALERRDFPVLREAMRENHEIVRSLGGSGAVIDELIEACVTEGALAAKLAGAGLGGTVIALTEEPDVLESRLKARGYIRFLRPKPQIGVRYED
ncbi:MAG TPA: hypothetical protein VM328_00890 [Fimbriimonadaceae bacterium]|nr:hypothetical protein [Fimbriimonadaceae bacterium]